MGHRDGEKEGVMPKERVQSSCDPFHLEIRWDPEQDIRVGMCESEGRSLFWQLTIDNPLDSESRWTRLAEVGAILREALNIEWIKQSDDPAMEWIKASDDPAMMDHDAKFAESMLNGLDIATGAPAGIWMDLSRTACNRLIQVTRRGRNQVFGGDE